MSNADIMKSITLIFLTLILSTSLNAQRYFTRNGEIKFFSETPVENIEAVNNKVLCIIDLDKGQVAVDMLIKAFEFKKTLMQEHFNENYMESDVHPKSTYKGKFEVLEELSKLKEGEYLVPIVGEIVIHGVKQKLDLPVNLKVKNDVVQTKFEFVVDVIDHQIKIPKVVRQNIAKEILVTAEFKLKPYKR